MKYLIINADDFGWDEETAAVTIHLFEREILTSASIMIGRPGTKIALDYAKQNQHRFTFGLHFNMVDGHWPLSSPSPASLIARSGAFAESPIQRRKSLMFAHNPAEIEHELAMQLNLLKEHAVNISHVDSHGHLHKFPQIILSMRKTLHRYGIKRVRIPQNLFGRNRLKKRCWNWIFELFFLDLPRRSQYFYMLDDYNNEHWFCDFISTLPLGLTELGIHPGRVDEWRKFETAPFLSMNIRPFLSDKGIQLVTSSYEYADD